MFEGYFLGIGKINEEYKADILKELLSSISIIEDEYIFKVGHSLINRVMLFLSEILQSSVGDLPTVYDLPKGLLLNKCCFAQLFLSRCLNLLQASQRNIRKK
jgi:hypothetical protein